MAGFAFGWAVLSFKDSEKISLKRWFLNWDPKDEKTHCRKVVPGPGNSE